MMIENWVSVLSCMIGLSLLGTLVSSVVLYVQYKSKGGSRPVEIAAQSSVQALIDRPRRRLSFG